MTGGIDRRRAREPAGTANVTEFRGVQCLAFAALPACVDGFFSESSSFQAVVRACPFALACSVLAQNVKCWKSPPGALDARHILNSYPCNIRTYFQKVSGFDTHAMVSSDNSESSSSAQRAMKLHTVSVPSPSYRNLPPDVRFSNARELSAFVSEHQVFAHFGPVSEDIHSYSTSYNTTGL